MPHIEPDQDAETRQLKIEEAVQEITRRIFDIFNEQQIVATTDEEKGAIFKYCTKHFNHEHYDTLFIEIKKAWAPDIDFVTERVSRNKNFAHILFKDFRVAWTHYNLEDYVQEFTPKDGDFQELLGSLIFVKDLNNKTPMEVVVESTSYALSDKLKTVAYFY